MDTSALFVQALTLSDEGQSRLREARDWLRDYYGGAISVAVYGRDVELAKQQAEAVRDYLADNLQLSRDAIKAHGQASDDYWRTEISGR